MVEGHGYSTCKPMEKIMQIVYANSSETRIYSQPKTNSRLKNSVLMGTWLEVSDIDGDWRKVRPRSNRGKGGWVKIDELRETSILKVFFVDVGQGDAVLIESPNGVIIVDGGPNKGLHKFLRHRYWPILKEQQSIHIDAVVVSHPDADHFNGLTHLLKDKKFTFGSIYHNGILRFRRGQRDFDLGKLTGAKPGVLTELVDDLEDIEKYVGQDVLMAQFERFWKAAIEAKSDGRLNQVHRVTNRNDYLKGFGTGKDQLTVSVLGPVPTSERGRVRYVGFASPHDSSKHSRNTPRANSSHTRNGHSVVLKLEYGDHSLLLGGDLNIPAERHLIEAYKDCDENPFEVTVAKACHHGSSDFTTDFLKRIRPYSTVFSSGDNKSFDHPMPDAIGAAAKHSRGDIPLLFSTELGRALSSKGTHFGLVNLRSNGKEMVMAQMKEQHNRADVWDSFSVPYEGRFPLE